ncbi:SDR family NAD(P)-dependent oxidoreductase [Dactylosporangium aurantiacum]|uniref:SDR family NAD(P)-dependent oxidoreductase n=1 Tax=Dactylosporangium aurantiacum TaxID=35754 RepID=A0A9Q9IA03_9ACTN|nr:SDR family oxidoreductase [Dactylosporangium aurantiacum]MDG6107051.1 SDR family oxidoreductase [Dactylosporangium aurantiacum]UWZ50600.1 SDR family NAD(P)-dependent oxidoreductase [Dactylosporangium aurantiacum]
MRSVIVTGAAQGLGRAHALALAEAGARLVLNDLDADALADVAARTGAVAVPGDIADWDFAAALVDRAVAAHGRLDALVNNAGLARDRMVVNLAEDEWDAVMRVNLKGTAAPLRHAAAHWRARAKAGEDVAARVVNTTSGAGLMGSVGQASYSAAKAGIAALTVVAAAELARYGVTVNAIAPSARTAMTETVFADAMRAPDTGFDAMAPDNVSPLVVWLAGADSGDVTGRVFEVSGGAVSVADGWQHGETRDAGRRWHPDELGPVVRDLLSRAPAPAAVYGA